MKKVLITNMYAGFGGGERCIQDHIRFLVTSGIACDLILQESGEFAQIAADAGANVTEMPFQWQGSKYRSLLHLVRQLLQSRAFLKQRRPDIHIAYTLNDLVIIGLAARSLRIPVVYRAQADVFGDSQNLTKTWLGSLLLPILKLISPLIICTTRYEQKNLIQMGFSNSSVLYIPLGVDFDFFQSDQNKEIQLRETLGHSDWPIVAIFGRLTRWKGQKTFISALIELKNRGINVCGWVVGDASFGDGDEYTTELKLLAHELASSGRIRFLGFRHDVNHLMSACDIICHASESEPFGLVIIEAMALARPVVASNVSGPKESVIDGDTGYLFTAGDHNDMADKLEYLISDKELREKMGAAGQRRARKYFNLSNNLQRLHQECVRFTQHKQ